VLNLTVDKPYEPTAAEDRKVKNHIARKSGHKHVHGNLYKPKSWGQAITEFFAASRGSAVMAKAHFESKHYTQAAILRKHVVAEQKAASSGRALSCSEYDDTVWNSNGVQNRLTREDQIRYGDGDHYEKRNGASGRNRAARVASRAGHLFHGACELNSAPTGMTQNCSRSFFLGQVDEKSLKNKGYMLGTLALIGTGLTTLLRLGRSESRMLAEEAGGTTAKVLTQSVLGALIAFPAVSATMGVLGTLAGVVSQATVQKQALSHAQKEKLSQSMIQDLQKLVHLLRSIKGNPQQIEVVGKAMQGRYHLLQKIKDKDCNEQGVPNILHAAIDALDDNNTESQNLNALKTALGQYLQVDKPPSEDSNLWQRYKYSKQVTNKESEYVALMSVVDHSSLNNPHGALQKDLRKHIEERFPLPFRNLILKSVAYPASVVDKIIGTNAAGTLRKWASPEYLKKHAEKLADPARAHKNRYNAQYMTKHIHQYKFATRCLIKLSETLRLTAMNVVLAQNANLSRGFANSAATIQRTLGTGPASRSMCQSIGRAFGGTALACLTAFGFTSAAAATGHGYTLEMDVGTNVNASASAISSGIMMFLLSVPSFALMMLATQTAKLEGWKGNLAKEVPKGVRTYTM
jgi:hypothetical protein